MHLYQTSDSAKYLHVSDTDVSLLLNVRQKKGDPYYIVENNLINRIVLGLQQAPVYDAPLLHSMGLMDYQKRDVAKMLAVGNVLNANPMGLGKTVEAIIGMREMHVSNALIVTPKTIMLQWKKQLEYWWPQSAGKIDILPSHPSKDRIAIYNYERIIQEETNLRLRSFRWDLMVCDEAHRIKNAKSRRSIAAKSIPAATRWALTGTPILRHPDDLWSILQFLDESYSGISYWNFVYYFCEIEDGFWGRKILGLTTNPVKIAVLNKLIEAVSVRNNLEVAEGKQRSIVSVSMGAKQAALYKKAKELLLDELPESLTIPNGAVLATRLLQITSWPGLFEEGVAGAKFEWIKEKLENNPDEKFTIFCRFAKSAEALQQYLKANSIHSVLYTGDMNIPDRAEAVREFEIQPKVQAIIGTIGAMGQGVDGLQNVSRTVIFLERDWSPELVAQCEDRVHRLGQKYMVTCYYLECDKTFDQYVYKINLNKAEDIRRALADDPSD